MDKNADFSKRVAVHNIDNAVNKRALFGYQKIKCLTSVFMAMAKKHCCVPFCPSSHAKNPDLSFFRIPKEKCRQDPWLRAIGMQIC